MLRLHALPFRPARALTCIHLARDRTLATAAAAAAPTATATIPTLATSPPTFDDPFASEQLSMATLIARDPREDLRRVRMSGRHCGEILRRLAGDARSFDPSLLATASAAKRVVVGPWHAGGDGAFVCWVPATASGTGQQMLEVYANANSDALDALVDELTGKAYHGNHVRVEHDVFLERSCERSDARVSEFPEVAALLVDGGSEPERKSTLRQMGLGTDVVYQAWKEQLDLGIRLMTSPTFNHVEPAVSKLVRTLAKRVRENIEQHLHDDRRAETFRHAVHMAIVGEPNVGKSSLLNLLAQSTVGAVGDMAGTTSDVHHEKINIDGIPVVFNDTVGMTSATLASSPSSTLATTIGRMDSADIKIVMLDMPHLYADKSSAAIDPALLAAIDSDTIVLLNKRDRVAIRTPAPPAKIRFKNSPLGPQGDVVRRAFRGRVPLRVDGDTTGNTIEHGDYGLRVLSDVRLADRCLQECRATLFRYIKNVKGGRFWLRVSPDHPMSSKPLGVRMGKGKGAFDHWEAKVPNKKILFEIGGGVREDLAREALRAVAARVPGQTEFVTAPIDEKIPELCARIADYARVKPLGVWCVSCTTGEGVDDFLRDLVPILRRRYGATEDDQSLDLKTATELRTTRNTHLTETHHHLTALLADNVDAGTLLRELTVAREQLAKVVEGDAVRDALAYLYHSKYGVLKEKGASSE